MYWIFLQDVHKLLLGKVDNYSITARNFSLIIIDYLALMYLNFLAAGILIVFLCTTINQIHSFLMNLLSAWLNSSKWVCHMLHVSLLISERTCNIGIFNSTTWGSVLFDVGMCPLIESIDGQALQLSSSTFAFIWTIDLTI